MALYKVILHGEGIQIRRASVSLLGLQDRPELEDFPIIGFYATRMVGGVNEHEAGEAAISVMLEEWAQTPLKDINRGSAPRLTIDSIKSVGLLDYFRSPKKGFTFYSDYGSEQLGSE